MSAQTAGPDFEGVLRDHQPRRGQRDLRQHCVCGWDSAERAGKGSHRAHVAAALRAEVRAWLGREGVRGVLADAYDSRPAVESSADSMRAALAALAEQVGQVASVGEGEGS